MLAAKLAEMSLVLRLPWAYHLEINDKNKSFKFPSNCFAFLMVGRTTVMSSWICSVKRKPFFIHFRELEIQEQLAFTA